MNNCTLIKVSFVISLSLLSLLLILIGFAGLAQAAPVPDSGVILSVLEPAPLPLLLDTPVLTVTKSSVNEGGDPLRPGERITYTITISNSGDVSATNVTISDTFPANTNFVVGSLDISPIAAGGALGTQPILADGITITAPSVVTVTNAVTVDVSVADGIQIVNTASITSNEVATLTTSTVTDIVVNEADLSISKTNGSTQTIPGTSTTYTIVVSNSGPSSANGITVTDTFPASLTGVTWSRSGTGGSCPGSGSGNINCTVNLLPNSSVTFTVSAMVSPGARGSLANTATLTLPAGVTDTTPGNNSATDIDMLDPEADLVLFKSDSPTTVRAGDILTYTLLVSNLGPSDRTQVTLTDFLPVQVTFLSATPGSPTCDLNGTSVICNLSVIAGGSSISVTIRVRVNSSTPAGSILNQAQVDSSIEEGDPGGNNFDSESTAVQVRPDLTIAKVESADPSPVDTPLTYILHITNNGPSDAPQVNVSDNMPNGVPLGPISPSQGTCTGTDPINCSLGSMTSGATATVTIVVNPTSTGTLNNTASVSVTGSGVSDPNTGNNSSNITTTVNRQTDLSITNVDSPDPVLQGNLLTYNLTVVNNGPSNAMGVEVTQTLPAGVTFQSATPSQGGCSMTSVLTCTSINIVQGGNATIAVIVKVNDSTAGQISSTASVSGGGGSDPNTINNSTTITTFVGEFKKVFLPLVTKAAPTELSVFNDKTGGNVTFTVVGTGVSCTVPNNTTRFCGSFPPGTYTVQATSACGNATTPITFGSGPVTKRIFCK